MLKKTVILINPTNLDPPPNYFGPPYGLSLIGALLLEDGRLVKAFDFDRQAVETMVSSVKKIVHKYKPCYIGITIQSTTRGPVYELIKVIKKIDKSIILILGGAFASVKYDLLLRNFPVDYAVIGDGEVTLVELLNCLDVRGDIKKVQGIAFSYNNDIYRTKERKRQTNLDLFPCPAFGLFKNFDREIQPSYRNTDIRHNFILGKRCTTLKNALLLLSSRGCIYNCNFCPMSKVQRNKIRFHSPRYFVDMVEHFYKKYKIRDYIFGDNIFTLVRSRVIDICDQIISRGLDIRWSCMTRADYVDQELLKKMAKAGCFEISYGIESGSEKIQKIIRKDLNLTLAKEAFLLTKKSGIRSILMLMVGNLGENNRTIKETLSYVQDITPDNILVKILKVYPGTEIHDIFEKKGLFKKDYYLSSEFNPPSFTLENSQQQLDKFAKMLQTRRVFIQIHGNCNNNCTFCSLGKKQKSKTFNEIKSELILASVRGEYIIFSGGEFFLRKDFIEILDYVEKLKIHHLYIYTNARMFFYKSLVNKIKKYKSVQKIIIPFFGFQDMHDKITRVQGSFSQMIKGIKNLVPRLLIQADIIILHSNHRLLFDLTQFLLDCGIEEFHYIFRGKSTDLIEAKMRDMPLMSETVSQLKKVSRFLKQSGKSFSFEGFPLCALKGLSENAAEPHYPFNEVFTFDRKVVNCKEKRKRMKKKFNFCTNCKEDNLCEGVWKDYCQVYGASEFKPY